MGYVTPLLAGRVLTQVFQKPSLRTRVSFEAAISQLGGRGIFLSGSEAGLEGREPLKDVARVISAYSDAVVLRTFSQELILRFRPTFAVQRDQRPVGCGPSLPGADRCSDHAGSLRGSRGEKAGLCRRWEQRCEVTGVDLCDAASSVRHRCP